MSTSELTQLANLITSSLTTLQGEWQKAGIPEPSLDPSSAIPPRFLSVEADNATRTIVGAAKQLSILVAGPLRWSNWQCQMVSEVSALDVLMKSGIADIVTTAEDGTSVDFVAQKTGMNAEKLVRIMRLLSTMDIFTEVKERRFRVTSVGRQWQSTGALYPVYKMQINSAKSGLGLYDALIRPDFANSFAVNKTAFNIAQNTDKGMFEHILSQQDPEKLELFVQAMKKIGVIAAESAPKSYPWDALGNDATVVDVGGGTGLITMAVIKSFPQLKLVVQDVESAIDEGRKTWLEDYPAAVQNKRVQFMQHDFFTENPVKGAAAYFLRSILHDWPDEKCIEIIRNIAISMTNDSRLLINEILVEPLYRDGQVHDVAPGEQGVGDAPEPLPANYGDPFQFCHDNMMMVHFHGKERNREEFVELVAKAGLEVTRIYTLAGVQDAVVECRKPSK